MHPIATLHYSESVYSIINPKEKLQTNFWKREFWSKEDVEKYFAGNPERPKSYIRNVPIKVTWTKWAEDDPNNVDKAKSFEEPVSSFDKAKFVIENIDKLS